MGLYWKFKDKRPTMQAIHKNFARFSLKAGINIGLIGSKHVLMRLHTKENYIRLWFQGNWIVLKCPMKVFKRILDLEPSSNFLVMPKWFSFPDLLVIHYHKNYFDK